MSPDIMIVGESPPRPGQKRAAAGQPAIPQPVSAPMAVSPNSQGMVPVTLPGLTGESDHQPQHAGHGARYSGHGAVTLPGLTGKSLIINPSMQGMVSITLTCLTAKSDHSSHTA